MRWSYVAGFCMLSACRFGDTGGSATAPLEPVDDAGTQAEAEDAAPPVNREDAEKTPEDGEKTPPTAMPSVDASSRPPEPSNSSAACTGPEAFDVCDPIHDTGCVPPFTQCILDPSASGMTGMCVLVGIAADDPCEEGPVATSCPPQHACVEGECREYCVCDDDCDAGSVCNVDLPSGSSGLVKACGS